MWNRKHKMIERLEGKVVSLQMDVKHLEQRIDRGTEENDTLKAQLAKIEPSCEFGYSTDSHGHRWSFVVRNLTLDSFVANGNNYETEKAAIKQAKRIIARRKGNERALWTTWP